MSHSGDVMVNAVGQALVRDNMVKGQKIFSLTAITCSAMTCRTRPRSFSPITVATRSGTSWWPRTCGLQPYCSRFVRRGPTGSHQSGGNQVTIRQAVCEFGLPFGGWLQPEYATPGPPVKATERHLANGVHHDCRAALKSFFATSPRIRRSGEPCLDRIRVVR